MKHPLSIRQVAQRLRHFWMEINSLRAPTSNVADPTSILAFSCALFKQYRTKTHPAQSPWRPRGTDLPTVSEWRLTTLENLSQRKHVCMTSSFLARGHLCAARPPRASRQTDRGNRRHQPHCQCTEFARQYMASTSGSSRPAIYAGSSTVPANAANMRTRITVAIEGAQHCRQCRCARRRQDLGSSRGRCASSC